MGPNLIIEYRLSGEEDVPGGITVDETVEFAKLLDGHVDIIHVSAATFPRHRDRIPHVPERILSTRPQCARRRAHQGGGQAVRGLCGRRIE